MSFHSFRGNRAAKPAQTQAKFSQASNRNSVTTYDQFGRMYKVPVEKNSGAPCGNYDPCFQAPWFPDFHINYWIINPDNTSELFLNLRQFVADRIVAMKEYHARAVRICERKGWPPPKLGEYPEEITDLEKPPRAYQLAVALEQRNPWVLGETDVPDPRLVKYLEQPSREIEEAIDVYDFGAESYAGAVAGRITSARRASPPKPARFTSLHELSTLNRNELRGVDPDDADAVANAFGLSPEELEAENGELSGLDSREDGDGETQLDGVETLPTDSEGAEASAAEERLMDIEEDADKEALGGRTVRPEQTERVERQAPRRPPRRPAPPAEEGATSIRRGPNREFVREGRRTLADGAKPVIG